MIDNIGEDQSGGSSAEKDQGGKAKEPILSPEDRETINRLRDSLPRRMSREEEREEEKELFKLFRKGGPEAELARMHLEAANLRLVLYIAIPYQGRGVSVGELVSEGTFGLQKAIKKFDLGRGLRFSTYATWWIRQAISLAIAHQSRMIRIPKHAQEDLGAVNINKVVV